MQFKRIAVISRGEPAMRLINAVEDLKRERRVELTTIALYVHEDRRSMFVRQADEAYELDAPVSTNGDMGNAGSPLDLDHLEAALKAVDADAAWLGWGSVAEYGAFATLCSKLGVTFIGPDRDTIIRLGDPLHARMLAEEVGVPVANPGENLPRRSRHIEVQIIGDHHGTIWPVGLRDCTVQRAGAKLISESPSPALSEDQHRSILDAAARFGRAARFTNVGTLKFVVDRDGGQFWFSGIDVGLHVEHPITEFSTGLDLVKLQILAADGQKLEVEPPITTGHAIEVRLNAEDPYAGFAPASGRLDYVRIPSGPGIRVDTGVEEGDEISLDSGPLIAKIMAFGTSRSEALARLRRALGQTFVVVQDGVTNKAFLERILDDEAFEAGAVDQTWLDETSAIGSPPSAVAPVAVVAGAIAAFEEEMVVAIRQFKASANRGRPVVQTVIGRAIGLGYRGEACDVKVAEVAPSRYRLDVGGTTVSATVEDIGLAMERVTIADMSYRVLSLVQANAHFVEVDGIPHLITHDEGAVVRSPSPALVTSVDVAPGDVVERGDVLAVIEAMKMETRMTAPFAGRIREVQVRENVQIPTGFAIAVIDAEGDQSTVAPGSLDFSAMTGSPPSAHIGCMHHLDEVRHMLLGYDVDPAVATRSLTTARRVCLGPIDEEVALGAEDEILGILADVLALLRTEDADGESTDPARRSTSENFLSFLRKPERRKDLPKPFRNQLKAVLAHYGVMSLKPTADTETALYRIVRSVRRMPDQAPAILAILDRRLRGPAETENSTLRGTLERLNRFTVRRFPSVHDLVREVTYTTFDSPFLEAAKRRAYDEAETHIQYLLTEPDGVDRDEHITALVECPQSLTAYLSTRFSDTPNDADSALLEVMMRRYYRLRGLNSVTSEEAVGHGVVTAEYEHGTRHIRCLAAHATYEHLDTGTRAIAAASEATPPDADVVADLFVWSDSLPGSPDHIRDEVLGIVNAELGRQQLRRLVVVVSSPESGTGIGGVLHFTFRADGAGGYVEETLFRDVHPMMGDRLQLWRLENFETERLVTLEDIYLFHGKAKDNPRDERLFGLAEVRDVTAIREPGRGVVLPDLERMFHDVLGAIRRYQAHRPAVRRLAWNRVLLHVWPVLEMGWDELNEMVERLAPDAEGIGLHLVEVAVRVRDPQSGDVHALVVEFSDPTGDAVVVNMRGPHTDPIEPLTRHQQNLARLNSRGLAHPSDIIDLLTLLRDDRIPADGGSFQEYDLVDDDLVPVDREWEHNEANIVVGIITNTTPKHPEGMQRVILLGDPSRGMGNLAEAECSRIMAALDLAEDRRLPLEWFAVSAGALISMESGTENMDWIALVLRRLIEFTQDGGEVNIIVTNINVGAQPYWNAEATMLMHTRGILVMTPDGAMVLTGKQALDYSGGVSAVDNFGIGGYGEIMGPNGQAQYFASDLADACRILLSYYEHAYVVPGERFPRSAETTDPVDRNIEGAPHGGDFLTVGEVFSEDANPGRKRPFEIRKVMSAVVDADHEPLERWFGMADAEVAVVWDSHIGGYPVCLIGLESKSIDRQGYVPVDGPNQWTSGTLFPMASKKVARSVSAASGNRPLVVLANLSGFDGSPESLRNLQLEYGAEIGRAIVNFEGPIVFVVISRYHGGAFVVFSGALNDNMEVIALEGAKASVIGGAPAAAVVFAREVRKRVQGDPRIADLRNELSGAAPEDKAVARAKVASGSAAVHSEKLGEIADIFDSIHTVERALDVGSIDAIIAPSNLRPYLVEAIERGMSIELARVAPTQ